MWIRTSERRDVWDSGLIWRTSFQRLKKSVNSGHPRPRLVNGVGVLYRSTDRTRSFIGKDSGVAARGCGAASFLSSRGVSMPADWVVLKGMRAGNDGEGRPYPRPPDDHGSAEGIGSNGGSRLDTRRAAGPRGGPRPAGNVTRGSPTGSLHQIAERATPISQRHTP